VAPHAPGVLVGLALGGGGLAEAPPGCTNLTVETRYLAEPEPSILFEVRSDQPCTMYQADLPWGNFYSVRLSVRDASGRVCSRATAHAADEAQGGTRTAS